MGRWIILFACIFVHNVLIEVSCTTEDPYNILGIKRTASALEIKKAYKRLARSWHPDKNKDPAAQEKIIKINAAYEILSDVERRQEYDRYGTVGDHNHGGQHPQYQRNQGFHHFSQGPKDTFSFFFNEMPYASFFNSRSHSKSLLTYHYLKHTVMGDSFNRPYMVYVYGDWCFDCARAEEVWDEVSADFESIGLKTYDVHAEYDSGLTGELGVRRVPAFVAIIEGRVVRYKRPEMSRVALRDFLDSLLPAVAKIDSSSSLEFFKRSFKENKPQVLLFSRRLFVPLLFTVTAFENRKRINFAFVDVTAVATTSLRKKYNVKDSETTVILLKEEPSNPVAVLKDASLKRGALRDLVSGNQFMYLSRISSWEIFDELCPVSSMSERRLCVVLFTKKSKEHSGHRYSLRVLAKEPVWKKKGVHFLYVNEDVQKLFAAAFDTTPELDPCIDGSETLKLVVLWHRARGKMDYDWFPGGWCGYSDKSGSMKTELEIMLTDLIQRRKPLKLEASFNEIVDEHEKSSVTRLIEKTYTAVQYILDSFDSPNWNSSFSLFSFIALVCLIVMFSILLPMTDDFRDFGKKTDSKKPTVDETVLGLRKLSPSNQRKLVSGAPPGQVTIVLLLDAESLEEVARSPLTQAFADAIYGYTANSSYLFTYLLIQDHLVWCTEIMEVTKFGEIVPGTVLAINGYKKYVYVFKPSALTDHGDGYRQREWSGCLTGDFVGLDDSEEEADMDALRQLERRKQKVGALQIRKHLPIWLERLYEGTLKDKKVLDQWPKME